MGKRIAIAVAALVLAAIAGFAYLWHELTALPDWYVEGETDTGVMLEADTDADVVVVHEPAVPDERAPSPVPEAAPAPTSEPKKSKRAGGRQVVRGFHRRRKTKGRSPIKASRAVYEGGRLEAGVVLDLSRVPRDKLSPRDKRLYERAVEGFPGLTKRDVYVGLEDRPNRVDGRLQLGPKPKLRVGNIRYGLARAAGKLGMSPAELRHELDRELRKMGFD